MATKATPSPMAALNPAMRLFVERYHTLSQDGDKPGAAADAAIYAGYKCYDRQAACRIGARMLGRADVQDALLFLTTTRMRNYAPRALELLVAIAEGKADTEGGTKPPWSVRHSAIRDILASTGFGPKQQIDVNHKHEVSYDAESIAAARREILANAGFMGDALPEEIRLLLPHIVDAEFEEAVPADALDFLDEPL